MAKEKTQHVLRIHVASIPKCDVVLEFSFPEADLHPRIRRALAVTIRDTLPPHNFQITSDAAYLLLNQLTGVRDNPEPTSRFSRALVHQGITFKEMIPLNSDVAFNEKAVYCSSSTLVPAPGVLERYAVEKFPETGQSVVSSNIARIGLVDDRLFVTFSSGLTYVYEGATEQIYRDLLAAESVGSLIRKTVINVLPCSVLDVPANTPGT